MKILVFSDTHLFLPFDQQKFDFLYQIISKADRVIINGDFFDGYMTNFNDFVNSKWSQLFPLLKDKKTVYVYGNHDRKRLSDRRVNFFSVTQADRYSMIIDNKKYIFEHGHKTRITLDVTYDFDYRILKIALMIGHFFRGIFTKIFGKYFIILRFAYRNNNSKKYINKYYQLKNNETYIIGHNHYGEVDDINHFASSGMILYGFYQYLIIYDHNITLHEGWYK